MSALEHASGEILGHAVGLADQLGQQLFAARRAHIDGDAQLLGVVVVVTAAEFEAPTLVDVGPDAAQDVPTPFAHRVLDADHLRAERGEEPRRAGARQLAAQVADAQM